MPILYHRTDSYLKKPDQRNIIMGINNPIVLLGILSGGLAIAVIGTKKKQKRHEIDFDLFDCVVSFF